MFVNCLQLHQSVMKSQAISNHDGNIPANNGEVIRLTLTEVF